MAMSLNEYTVVTIPGPVALQFYYGSHLWPARPTSAELRNLEFVLDEVCEE
jgi:hypothetical protein